MGLRSGIIRAANAFIAVNRGACRRLEAFLPQAKTSIFDQYIGVVADIVNGKLRNPIIVDVGGGRQCPFEHVVNRVGNTTNIAVAISEDEIKQNNDVTGTSVADIAVGLPFASRTVDLITSRSVLEHIED